jgi:hypothetical protein
VIAGFGQEQIEEFLEASQEWQFAAKEREEI